MSHPSVHRFGPSSFETDPLESWTGMSGGMETEGRDPVLMDMLSQAMAGGAVPSGFDLLAFMPSLAQDVPPSPPPPVRAGWRAWLRLAFFVRQASVA